MLNHPPRLTLISDRTLYPTARLAALAPALAAAGLDALHVREKDLPAADLRALARALVPAFQAVGVRVFINGAVAVAVAAGADGVQLGEGGDVATARREAAATGRALLVGRSVHDVTGAVAAAQAGADLLVLGTIYPSRSHPGGATAGPALVQAVTERTDTPVIAIGGVTESNAAEVIAAGAAGVAVISAILAADDRAAATRQLRQVIDAALAEGAGRSAFADRRQVTQASNRGVAHTERDEPTADTPSSPPSLVGKGAGGLGRRPPRSRV